MNASLVEATPSLFCCYPWDSRLKNTEAEIVALNIMKIRKRRGNKWSLDWDTYRAEREKDGAFTQAERVVFDQVMPLVATPQDAVAFCDDWAAAVSR